MAMTNRGWNKNRMRILRKRSPTFDVTLRRLGGFRRPGRLIKTLLRRVRIDGFAMTILSCSQCKWEVWLEAHHQYGNGKPLKIDPHRFKTKKDYERHKKWRAKMLRTKLTCPKCDCDTFRYVKTMVMNHGDLYSELAE